jgi:hypothetical protein
MSLKQEQLISNAMIADIDTLLATIGYHISNAELGVAPNDKQTLIEKGRLWLQNHTTELQEQICSNTKVQSLLRVGDDENNDVHELIIVVIDIIAAIYVGVPAVSVAVLLVKIGLRRWCNVNSIRE